jgi:hypothetical protein
MGNFFCNERDCVECICGNKTKLCRSCRKLPVKNQHDKFCDKCYYLIIEEPYEYKPLLLSPYNTKLFLF